MLGNSNMFVGRPFRGDIRRAEEKGFSP
jgi:hypothetical protein